MTRGIIDQTTDTELLRAHLTGDVGAFRELYDRHRTHMWAIALRTTGNPDDAADAIQDAWVSIHSSANSYRADASVASWLHKIVVNSCLDRLRRISSHDTVPLFEFSAILADEHDYTEDVDVSLSIGRALDVLPPDQRAAVILVDLHGYSIRDAAIALDVPFGTVKSRCSRGREKLALVLGYLRDDF